MCFFYWKKLIIQISELKLYTQQFLDSNILFDLKQSCSHIIKTVTNLWCLSFKPIYYYFRKNFDGKNAYQITFFKPIYYYFRKNFDRKNAYQITFLRKLFDKNFFKSFIRKYVKFYKKQFSCMDSCMDVNPGFYCEVKFNRFIFFYFYVDSSYKNSLCLVNLIYL